MERKALVTLLIVDDDEDSRYILRVLLEGNGYAAALAANGVEAMEIVRTRPPSMIVSDILMPEMDAFSLCRQLKLDAKFKEIPFLFYTATYTDPGDEALALSLGAERFLVKPIEPLVLLGVFREVFEELSRGRWVASYPPEENELPFLRSYNAALIRKLEDKMVRLEQVAAEQAETNATLKLEVGVRKEAERVLRRSEAQVRLLLNSTAEAIYGVGLEGRCTFANPACLNMLGYGQMSDLIGKNMHLLIHSQYWDGKAYPESQCRMSLAFKEKNASTPKTNFFGGRTGRAFPWNAGRIPLNTMGNLRARL